MFFVFFHEKTYWKFIDENYANLIQCKQPASNKHLAQTDTIHVY